MLRALIATLTLTTLIPFQGLADCLDELQNAARSQRICQVGQTRSDECDNLIKQTTVITQRCQAAGKRNSQTTFAIQEGFQSVQGDPALSPWQVNLRREREKSALLEEDRHRWLLMFDKSLSAPRQDGFDSNDCPLAYSGQKGRYLFVTSLVLPVRRDLSIYTGNNRADITHLYFSPMHESRCYGIRSPLQTARMEVDQPEFIYNLTEGDLHTLAQTEAGSTLLGLQGNLYGQLKIHQCKNVAECLDNRTLLEQQWQDYRKQLQQISEDETCIAYTDANRSGEINLNDLYKAECKTDAARKRLQKNLENLTKLESRLF